MYANGLLLSPNPLMMGINSECLAIVVYCTGHGLGHATRSLEICKHLVAAGHTVTVVTGAPHQVFLRELPSERLTLRHAILDTGAKQRDAFTVDQRGSLEGYVATAGSDNRDTLLDREASWLRTTCTDLVVSDIVPLACAAACAAGVPCVCVTNFSWDFIYSEYLTAAGSEFRRLIWQIADDYACALRLLRLPGHVPMPAFREVLDVPLVVRHAKRTRHAVRAELGISDTSHLAVFIYGGQPPGSNWKLEESCLPEGWTCVVCSAGAPPGGGPLPPNFILAPEDAYTPDLIGACDVVVGKIGYGTTSECLAHRKPLVFLRRDFFNEEPFLRKLLELHDAAVEMKRRDFLAGNWSPYLQRALALSPHYDEPTNGAEVVAGLLEHTAREFKAGNLPPTSPGGLTRQTSAGINAPGALNRPLSAGSSGGGSGGGPLHAGQSRLRDTIAWGYVMGRHASRQAVDVPDWYTRGLLPAEALDPTPATASDGGTEDLAGQFSILEGPPALEQSFPDTLRFLKELGDLESMGQRGGEGGQEAVLPEHRAAAGLFDWSEEVYVSRAPGRLDVMGGIADYSGATVLQMPIAEAAHVALQLQAPERQRLWRHQAARVAARGPGAQGASVPPALRIVSLNADATNRGPAFDMDLSELLTPEGHPISYAAAQEYFKRDPALAWAAYAAGALVVLMHECGVRPHNGIAMLVSSAVPEGKGVSSSAAVEVASMSALAAAHGVRSEGRQLALLCQKVENLIVGAPCGVMDQMASALGEAGWLLGLRCQPAEVEGAVHIPEHLRFWGVDSGIRHSVGGSDYGAVRTGAFMGLKIVSSLAGGSSGVGEKEEVRLIGGGYLANVAPSQFASKYEGRLPTTLSGADFLEVYGPHLDSVTRIDPSQLYSIRTPTAHPVYENFRVQTFRQVLAARHTSAHQQLEVLGELMLQSHESYTRCQLGSEGTNLLVSLVLEERAAAEKDGRRPALYGAKITGGGCGGTVAILGTNDGEGEAALKRVLRRYEAETAYTPYVFRGTSNGAVKFGVLRVRKMAV